MASDLPDVELYHRELLRNIEFRKTLKAARKRRQSALLSDTDTIIDEGDDKEFTSNYIQSCGFTRER